MKPAAGLSPRVLLWLAAAILSGAGVTALEMAAVRLFAPYFGYSIYVWGTTIGVVLAAMVAGYAIGGRLAAHERRRNACSSPSWPAPAGRPWPS